MKRWEVITSGSYFEKDGRHYIKYDEVQEDSNEVIRNLLKIENGSLELTRRGMTNVHMVFEKDKKKRLITTPHLEDSWSGISATHLDVSEKEDSIDVQVKYALEINSEYIADCSISICANSK